MTSRGIRLLSYSLATSWKQKSVWKICDIGGFNLQMKLIFLYLKSLLRNVSIIQYYRMMRKLQCCTVLPYWLVHVHVHVLYLYLYLYMYCTCTCTCMSWFVHVCVYKKDNYYKRAFISTTHNIIKIMKYVYACMYIHMYMYFNHIWNLNLFKSVYFNMTNTNRCSAHAIESF